ncbi:rhodanese-like domain-containing protein [Methylophilus sp. 13]|uniref:rhodanese-like domain-containing protein n=1 Tax=Methylophilus sp. 13 TaxID=2781018 RepID=UPI0018900554|nr:rhodanese-like domain-containing protein [Methylophilus sp. 13]MBF5037911.1 rhodanese-like domain-containing protein [Methylophilus sp. 13]
METLTSKQMVALAKQDIQEVDVNKANEMIKDSKTLIVDVREPGEFAEGHIAGAVNVPRGVLEFKLDPENSKELEHLQKKDLPMLVYCRSGSRSALAVQSIQKLGYSLAVSMIGGMEQWNKDGLPATCK